MDVHMAEYRSIPLARNASALTTIITRMDKQLPCSCDDDHDAATLLLNQ